MKSYPKLKPILNVGFTIFSISFLISTFGLLLVFLLPHSVPTALSTTPVDYCIWSFIVVIPKFLLYIYIKMKRETNRIIFGLSPYYTQFGW